MDEFYRTVMGRQFFDGTMPRIAKALERLVGVLENEALTLDLIDLLHDHDTAWDNEEDSVKAEHAALIRRTRELLAKLGTPQKVTPTKPTLIRAKEDE